MNIFSNIARFLPLAVIFLLAACTDSVESPTPENPGIVVKDGKITLTASLNMPEMRTLTSRTMGDTPEAGMKIKVLEFDWGTTDASSFLREIYDAELVSPSTGVDNDVRVTIKLTLKANTSPTKLQFIVTDADLGDISTQGISIASILQNLTVSDGKVAYFGQVELGEGFGDLVLKEGSDEYEFEVYDDLQEKLSNIPLIRNFAKISCQVSETVTNFWLEGFDLVNIPKAGSVAPWDPVNGKLAELLNDENKMKDYLDLPKGYKGLLASGQFSMTEAEVLDNPSLLQLNNTASVPRYMYAHPYEPYRRTYMIISGHYGSQTAPLSYYKVDLGYQDPETKMFTNYNIIRNYHYVVTITGVERAGYTSARDAVDGIVFNNLSASTETRDILSLSDGTNLLGVNMTRAVLVDDSPIVIKYQYRTGVGTGSGTVGNTANGLQVIGLKKGDVIESFSGPVAVGDSMAITINPVTPTDEVKEQAITIVDENGLGRTITLVSRTKWNMDKAVVYGKNAETNVRPTDSIGIVSPLQSQPLTLFFDLPSGIPESVFPLRFTIWSDRQNIENNSAEGAALLVTTLKPESGTPLVAYIRTVTYEQYQYMTNGNNEVSNPMTDNTDHTIRNRFRTTVALSNLPGNPQTMDSKITITNPYFNDATAEFTRTQ